MRRLSLIIILLLMVLGVSAADLKVDLASENFGAGQQLKGTVEFSYENVINGDVVVKAEIDGEKSEILLKDLLDKCDADYDYLEGFYSVKAGSDSTEKVINKEGVAGIRLPKNSQVKSAELKLSANGADKPAIDVGNDGINDFEYFGEQTGWSAIGVYPATASFGAEDGQELIMGNDFTADYIYYCEKIKLPFSKSFKVEVKNRVLESGNIELWSTLLDLDGKKLVDGCKLSVSGDEWQSCDVFLEKAVEDEHYVCVYAKGGYSDIAYYELPYEENKPGSAFICSATECKNEDLDYFIKIRAGEYDRILNGEIVYSGFETRLNEYLRNCVVYDETNCVVPLRITSEIDATLRVKEFSVVYQENSNWRSTSKFYDVVLEPAKISLVENVSLSLDEFEGLVAPEDLGSYTLKVKILDLESSADFKVTEVPVTIIKAKDLAFIGEEVEFNGLESEALANKSIVSYKWDFGDNTTGIGSVVKHSYSEIGDYTVVLEVEDEGGLIGSSSFTISVRSVVGVTESLLESSTTGIEDALENFKEATGSEKEVINLIGAIEELEKAKVDLDGLQEEFDATSDLNESMREGTVRGIYQDLEGVLNKLPKKVVIKTELSSYSSATNDDIKKALKLLGFGEGGELISFNRDLQDKVEVLVNVKLVKINYFFGDASEKTIFKKVVKSSEDFEGVYVVELLPRAVELLSGDFEIATSFLKSKFNNLIDSKEELVIYSVDGNSLSELGNFKTVVVAETFVAAVCGNGFCDIGETSESCSEDCACSDGMKNYDEEGVDCGGSHCPPCKKLSWSVILFILVVGAVAVYITVVKRPAFRVLLGRFKKKPLFKNEAEFKKLQEFVRTTLVKGRTRIEIRRALLAKKWNKEQVDYVFRRVK